MLLLVLLLLVLLPLLPSFPQNKRSPYKDVKDTVRNMRTAAPGTESTKRGDDEGFRSPRLCRPHNQQRKNSLATGSYAASGTAGAGCPILAAMSPEAARNEHPRAWPGQRCQTMGNFEPWNLPKFGTFGPGQC